ncbi:putative quinol monooxygenase [Arhodomonas sp. AD133]|uniref:putative quinol monooxygenase n=1 Tax=Arhodomonas sp. AD133 TaxID=3415009 RepID=UPI003EBB69D9
MKTQLKEGVREAFMEATLENAAASVREEPGCHVFDVLEDRDTPGLVYLYEIYDSPEALALHKETEHYRNSRAIVNELIAEQSVIKADVTAVNPVR